VGLGLRDGLDWMEFGASSAVEAGLFRGVVSIWGLRNGWESADLVRLLNDLKRLDSWRFGGGSDEIVKIFHFSTIISDRPRLGCITVG
jgi:hypothetical protein